LGPLVSQQVVTETQIALKGPSSILSETGEISGVLVLHSVQRTARPFCCHYNFSYDKYSKQSPVQHLSICQHSSGRY